jgi:hypothetical protein
MALKGYWKRSKGRKQRVRDWFWELRYAWERAWNGYDCVDVFNCDGKFIERMNLILPEFKKNNIGLWVKDGVQLDKAQTDAVLDEMIYEFKMADENSFMDWYEQNYEKILSDNFNAIRYNDLYHKHRQQAIKLFAEYFDQLWY